MTNKPYCVSWSSLLGKFYVYDRREDDEIGHRRLCPEQDRFYATQEEAWIAWASDLRKQAAIAERNAMRMRTAVDTWLPRHLRS